MKNREESPKNPKILAFSDPNIKELQEVIEFYKKFIIFLKKTHKIKLFDCRIRKINEILWQISEKTLNFANETPKLKTFLQGLVETLQTVSKNEILVRIDQSFIKISLAECNFQRKRAKRARLREIAGKIREIIREMRDSRQKNRLFAREKQAVERRELFFELFIAE